MTLSILRVAYHQQVFREILHVDEQGVPNIADKSSHISSQIAHEMLRFLPYETAVSNLSGQAKGRVFEILTADFLRESLTLLNHLRPGKWEVITDQTTITQFEQYEHLEQLRKLAHQHPELATILGGDYIITPDIVIARHSIHLNELDDTLSRLTPLLARQNTNLLLHASVSCKWTIRSDRAQNTRTEALNLIRNRKGRAPHIVALTAEPYPSRIASLALGTGDMDCVYHFALNELLQAAQLVDMEQYKLLMDMINGKRLRDISDLPYDLII